MKSGTHILFLTFEHPDAAGGGLSTYLRNMMAAVTLAKAKATILFLDRGMKAGETTTERRGDSIIISWGLESNPLLKELGFWTAASYSFSEKIKALHLAGESFTYIDSPDGFGVAYHTIQRKLAGEAPFTELNISITAHTPVSLINKWSGHRNYRLPDYWVSEMERFCLIAADSVVSPSRFLLNELTAWGVSRDDIRVIPNPCLLPRAQKVESTEHTEKDRCYITASRVHHFKGIPEVIAGFEEYWKAGGKSKLIVAGGDTFSAQHETSLTKHLVLKHKARVNSGLLSFVGVLGFDELNSLRTTARALFHPSIKENFPYTVLEHMATGGLVAASKSGGQAEIIVCGENGLLFDPLNPTDIKSTIEKLDDLSDSQVHSMGEAARIAVGALCDPIDVISSRITFSTSPRPERSKYPFIRGEAKIVSREAEETPRLISVVIPYFNLPEFLPETVKSALDSTYTNIEVIIVDDGSSDPEATAVAQELAKNNPRVKLITKQNSGVADTRNTGAMAAKGEYIALLDADDLVDKDYYRQCIEVLERYPNVGYVGSWNEDFNEKGTIRFWPTFNPEPPQQIIFNTTNCQGLVLRRQAFLRYGQHDPNLRMFLDDWECTISLLANDVRGVMLQHPLFRYRIRGGSIFRSKQGLWHTNYEKILDKHRDLVQKYAMEIALFLNQNGPNTNYHNPTFPSAIEVQPFDRPKKYKSPVRQAASDLARALKQTYRRPSRY